MGTTGRPGAGTKRISSGASPGQGIDVEKPHGRELESVDIIQDNRKSGNAGNENAEREGRRTGRGNAGRNVQKPGNVKTGREGQRAGNEKTGRESQKTGSGKTGRESQRAGNAKAGRDSRRNQNVETVRHNKDVRKGTVNGHARGVQEAAGQPVPEKRGKKPKRKKSGRKFLVGLLCGIIILAGLGYLVIVLFEVEQIVVTGNQYCSEQEIIDWLKQDKYSDNSLYLLWKYNQNDVAQLPAVEEAKVGLKDLKTVSVQVKEKTFSGRVDYEGKFLYFDQQGKAALITDSVIEGVPYIEGMEIKAEKITLGKALPEEEGQVYEEIKEIIPLLEKQGLSPDRIACEGTDLTLHFGGVRVQIGSGKFSERLAQVPPILEKLTEMYSDQTGVLHLENYDVSGSSIRFVPDTAEASSETAAKPQEEGEDAAAWPAGD